MLDTSKSDSGQLRHIRLEGAANLRDIGGLDATGGQVRWGAVYRSDSLSELTDADLARVAELGLAVAIDFRHSTEIERSGVDRLPASVVYDHIEVLTTSTTGPKSMLSALGSVGADGMGEILGNGNGAALMTETYRQLVRNEEAHKGFGRAVQLVADAAEDASALYHCHSGKDRTGWMTAILLSLLGVKQDEIFADYLSSNEYLRESNEAIFGRMTARGVDADLFRPIMEQSPAYLQASFDAVAQDYGDIEVYTRKALGVSDATVLALRERMIR